MNTESFTNLFWRQYVALEREFLISTQYVTVSEDNYKTYSPAYQKLLLSIGSEVDVAIKSFCKEINAKYNGRRMDNHILFIEESEPSFFNSYVVVRENEEFSLFPWRVLMKNTPLWWQVYTAVKHNRVGVESFGDNEKKEVFKYANLENTLHALAALYQVQLHCFQKIAVAENKHIQIPLPGSRLFMLKGELWNDMPFWTDYAFWIEDGVCKVEFSNIYF